MRTLEEVSIGHLKLKNRIVMPAMNTELANTEGEVTDELVAHCSARAPWLGMVVVEHSYVRPDGRLSPRQPGVYDDKLVAGLSRLAGAVRETGTPVAIQINHAGMKCDPGTIGCSAVGPSDLDGSRQLTEGEIGELVEAFGMGARRAVRGGFDAVEVHGSHGFLLCQFCSPLANKRADGYGGDLERRMRFPLEVVHRVKEETGKDAQLWYRLGADDRIKGGNTVADGARMGKMLASAGVDVLDVSGGMCGSRPPGLEGVGYFGYAARAVKQATGLPVVAVGGVNTPREAEEVLNRFGVDLVAVGRAILKNESWGKALYPES